MVDRLWYTIGVYIVGMGFFVSFLGVILRLWLDHLEKKIEKDDQEPSLDIYIIHRPNRRRKSFIKDEINTR